jgi:hypothetical protein
MHTVPGPLIPKPNGRASVRPTGPHGYGPRTVANKFANKLPKTGRHEPGRAGPQGEKSQTIKGFGRLEQTEKDDR